MSAPQSPPLVERPDFLEGSIEALMEILDTFEAGLESARDIAQLMDGDEDLLDYDLDDSTLTRDQ